MKMKNIPRYILLAKYVSDEIINLTFHYETIGQFFHLCYHPSIAGIWTCDAWFI